MLGYLRFKRCVYERIDLSDVGGRVDEYVSFDVIGVYNDGSLATAAKRWF
ncbi:hypothetical protein SAMN06265222_10714 [Neorhodopirellula lusitana]|uniref:Uncharacterized protein n=1 Tax=Neorhodopirellula lusitana TaxID=445327 RepID=A0ABY1Q5Z4_9BACT|nr:hypothetical protein [Neorhodopirellula lusitana]SMP60891.1 hypothetical protein SAMN06265222_10714 [Neorhodopirellula lusitana]